MRKSAGRHQTEGVNSWVSHRAIKRERQEICSSVINASEKSEQRVTSPQLITTRGKGKTNRYPDPVIHIWLVPIVLLARLPRKSVFPMLRGMFLTLFVPSTWGRTLTFFTWRLKKEWVWGQITALPMGAAGGHSDPYGLCCKKIL